MGERRLDGFMRELRKLKPMLAHFGAGLAAGIAVGLVICLTLLKPGAAR